jgi:hypothetical protein
MSDFTADSNGNGTRRSMAVSYSFENEFTPTPTRIRLPKPARPRSKRVWPSDVRRRQSNLVAAGTAEHEQPRQPTKGHARKELTPRVGKPLRVSNNTNSMHFPMA